MEGWVGLEATRWFWTWDAWKISEVFIQSNSKKHMHIDRKKIIIKKSWKVHERNFENSITSPRNFQSKIVWFKVWNITWRRIDNPSAFIEKGKQRFNG